MESDFADVLAPMTRRGLESIIGPQCEEEIDVTAENELTEIEEELEE